MTEQESKKPVRNILIKASGDVVDDENFFNFAVEQAQTSYVVVICGGGTQISEALKKAGYQIDFDKHGRIAKTLEERRIAREVLENQARKLQDKFVGKGVFVLAPILYAGAVLCHINSDKLVTALERGFDKIYVFTLESRVPDKQQIFMGYLDKVEIIGV